MLSRYDVRERRIYLAPGASLYAQYHELAHKEQHDKMVPAFVVWRALCQIRVIRYFVTVWIEWDAHRRARRVMEQLGLWTEESCREGRENIRTYIMMKDSQ